MARPRSDDRRNAILDAATRIVAAQGLGASTAAIAAEAGVSNGSLFTYFGTKTILVNELFVTLKTGMGSAALEGMPTAAPREQLLHLWNNWLDWATAFPERRKAIAQLGVSEEISPESHRAVAQGFAAFAALLDLIRTDGPLAGTSLSFVLDLITAIAETTIDSIASNPDTAAATGRLGFDAIWRVLAAPSMKGTS